MSRIITLKPAYTPNWKYDGGLILCRKEFDPLFGIEECATSVTIEIRKQPFKGSKKFTLDDLGVNESRLKWKGGSYEGYCYKILRDIFKEYDNTLYIKVV